ncbi:MAG: 50S ribosome-binding GTPase [Selenomonadaceae bacterium]|nr:50S ribosome-binding GTPase [Selenomonadaceae bacterium]
MYELKDYQSILSEKSGRVKTFFDKYPDASATLAPRFFDISENKIRTAKPEIMVYGIYNAGKSSILNELIGADKAAVAEVPTTDKVTYYEWQGYKIADTPGVMAPIEHENVTREHLKKADIVLFVMGTTGSNERAENYIRMKEIADSGKKIIIVLNDKNADLGNNENTIQIIKRQVAVNMETVGIEDVDERYCIVTVNALRAKKGRIENKAGLWAKSGMEELKSVILTELRSSTPFEVLRGGIRQIEQILDEFIENLESGENSEMVKNMTHVLKTFSTQKSFIRRQVNTYIDVQAENFGAYLPQVIWSNPNNPDQAVNAEINKLNDKVSHEIERQLQDAAEILELELKTFAAVKVDGAALDTDSFKNILSRLSESTNATVENTQAIVPQSDKNPDLSQLPLAGGLLAESAKDLLSTSIGKTLAKTALGKVAKSFIPVIGPVLTIIGLWGTLKDFLGNNEERKRIEAQLQQQNEAERQKIEAAKQARQEIMQKCRYLTANLADELKQAADNAVTETLSAYEEPFKAELKKRKSEGEQIGNDIVQLREIYNEYDLLRVELGAR